MATTTIRQADNGVYYVHWTEGRRSKRASLGTKDPIEAERRRAKRVLMQDEVQADTIGKSCTVADLWHFYDEKHVQRELAAPANAAVSWNNLRPFFGPLTVGLITQAKVDEYELKRAAGKIGRASRSTSIRRELAMLRACLNWCAHPKRRLLDPALLPHFDLPAEAQPRDRWLKAGEIEQMLKAAAALRGGDRLTRVERFLWLAIETAARKSALFELTWDRVDFETGVIHLNPPGRKQTKKRRADVPISKALRPILERAYAERINDLVLENKGEVWAAVQRVAGEAGLGSKATRFTEENGERKYLKRKATGISPHVLRHTAATHMARRGVPLWIVAKVLGNSLQMVEKVYAKHSPEDLRAAVDMITGK